MPQLDETTQDTPATSSEAETSAHPTTPEPAAAPAPPKRRIVVCCDGTWNRSDQKNITNIEKISRSIQTDPGDCGGVVQQVEYIAGVGVGYTTDRILGGWLGAGVFSNVRAAYRFLALNYEDGDEIFLFGFSRGAYTARSVAGMIGTIGLLTREALVHNHLAEALDRYKMRPAIPAQTDFPTQQAFLEGCCHPHVRISFLGVFDTVGSLGVPSVIHTDHQFHDITLGDRIRVARQALAIDERRRPFSPCLWSVPDDAPTEVTVTGSDGELREVPRVKQVWFPGVHCDVGGGYDRSGLSDTALKWMTDEATEAGLVFDRSVLDQYLDVGQPAYLHDSMNPMYRIADAYETVVPRPEVMKDTFVDGWRNLTPAPVPQPTEPGEQPRSTSIPVLVASSARERYDDADSDYRPDNLRRYLTEHHGAPGSADEEVVEALPAGAGTRQVAEAATTPGLIPERAQG